MEGEGECDSCLCLSLNYYRQFIICWWHPAGFGNIQQTNDRFGEDIYLFLSLFDSHSVSVSCSLLFVIVPAGQYFSLCLYVSIIVSLTPSLAPLKVGPVESITRMGKHYRDTLGLLLWAGVLQ